MVVGILIVVVINNSNVQKKDQIKETKYLENIKSDLQKDLASLHFNFRKEKYKVTNKLISQIKGQPIVDVTELTINFANTLMEERSTPNNSTYIALASSGNLNLMTNHTIKVLILKWKNFISDIILLLTMRD